MLEPAWNKLKQELKKELPPDQASLIDQMKLSDAAEGDSLMRQVAQAQLGPLLASVGSDEDPYSFFLDLVKIAACLQLGTAAAVFYTCELGLGLDVGDSFRAVAGLGLGYFARIFIPIEQLVWPVYNDLLQLFSPEAIFDAGPVSPQERSRTLNSLGVTVAAAFLLPRYLLGWAVDDTLQLGPAPALLLARLTPAPRNADQQFPLQIVLPMMLGLLFFDAAFLLALLYKLSALDRGGGSGGD
ncbi:hypothetical protein MNEG_10756 [Monoraphidium neglectum]|uniref:Uncharacterized protein n=1 Tax=Monoraphidium neglectum TaxID=145388 RepID=A0A0D2JBY4_9CHLO|nr:hypothetical protein MNEG_10756 [Monoraphidium neglectum]KIY97207.1 hypothetical protein MNEG_10756 [Monoraphidium neglectum]|eukprot:XP_013896227.1 hypothetical protein MNEG_10756 [Monoraphidium neglectum]